MYAVMEDTAMFIGSEALLDNMGSSKCGYTPCLPRLGASVVIGGAYHSELRVQDPFTVCVSDCVTVIAQANHVTLHFWKECQSSWSLLP